MHPPKIFISATSGDLGSVRQIVKECLLTINCHPVEQSNFEPDARTVEGKLRILALQEEVLGLKQEQSAVKTEVLKSRRLGLKAFAVVLVLLSGISNEVDGSRERLERLNFTTESKLALDRLESALKARDLTERGQTRAMEFLLTEDGRYAGADFDGVTFSSGRFTGADFSKCSFRDADLSGVVLSGGKLDGANLTFGTYEDANFDQVSARLVLFELSSGKGASFRDADLTQSSFHFADLRGADFSGAKLHMANFSFCDLRGAKFRGADLTDAIVYQNILTESDFKNAIIKNTIFSSNHGDTAMFTEDQRGEMRRCSLRRDFMTVKVFDQPPPNMHWDDAINSYDLSGFNKIYENASLSMSMRTLTKFHPRGTMGYYSEYLGSEINTRVHFEGSKFLSIGGRENRLKARLEAHAIKLAEVFTLDGMSWIEGLGHEQKAWINELDSKVMNTATPPSLVLNEDSEFVIALA